MHSAVDELLSNTRFRNHWHGCRCYLLQFQPAVVSMQQKNQPRDHMDQMDQVVALVGLIALVA
jgi:hypothetical protein